MAQIAELFGTRVDDDVAVEPSSNWLTRHCPFTSRKCDVTANRGDRAFFDRNGAGITEADRQIFAQHYDAEPIPLGICTVSTQRRFEERSKPWIICPKRIMDLRSSVPVILPEVKSLIPIKSGTDVRCWWEFKFASNEADEESNQSRFFEFTFDYILMPVDRSSGGDPILLGPPYILEIMTSSTRGGGLTEHMADALAMRKQRPLRGAVKSPYTPNYRQVFGRMASQLFAKSEAAQKWGGKTIWILQDVLLEYIEQTTAFRSAPFQGIQDGNVNLVVYKLDEHLGNRQLELKYEKTLVGNSRASSVEPDFTSMLGAGYVPPLSILKSTLQRTQGRKRDPSQSGNWVDFIW